jgi:1,4-alpha-glucan branching enzyme
MPTGCVTLDRYDTTRGMDLAPPAGKVGNDRENTSPAVDTRRFNEGTHYRLYEKLEAHPITAGRAKGTYFAVWASNAMYVSVVGNFNAWTPASHPLQARGRSGIWEGFAADVGEGAVYKYHIISHYQDYRVDKADPYDFAHVMPPHTASIVTDLWYVWGDQAARCR